MMLMRLPKFWLFLCCQIYATVANLGLASQRSAVVCERNPDETPAARFSGNNGFHLDIARYPRNESLPSPEGYIPGELYTVSIEGFRTKYTEQTFRGFNIIAIKSGSNNYSSPIGTFKMAEEFPEIQRSSRCPGAVMHSSLYPKTKVQAIWQAPVQNEGCLEFHAMVLEYRDIWYMDDGPLTRRFCQLIGFEKYLPPKDEDECCACDEAQYELSFQGLWSRPTHPKDYPTIEPLTHFSDLIGASHSAQYSMWQYGEYATDGLKELAEWGNALTMEEEMRAKAGKEIRTIIKARGLWYPHVQGLTNAVFRVDRYHHFMSMASMLGPSPDWLVGVSRFNLCKKDCTWVDQRSLDLFPWDAGTDSGRSYMSPNNPTLPRGRISPITTKDPPDSPFYNAASDLMPPLARLILRRTNTYEMECKNQSQYESIDSLDNSLTSEDLLFQDKPECEVGDWSPFSLCSATCGKGIRMRSRNYRQPVNAQLGGCKRQMIEKQFCNAPISECQNSEAFNELCTLKDWSAWTACSVSCNKGVRSRTRVYDNPMAVKACRLPLMEKEACVGAFGADCDATPDPRCRTTYWSEWSPCSVTCGQGLRVRTRLLYYAENEEHCREYPLLEKETCSAKYGSCEEIVYLHKEEICVEAMEPGQCEGVFPRFYFDAALQQCRRFIFTGCRGNRNNFESEEQCEQACITGPTNRQEDHGPVLHDSTQPSIQSTTLRVATKLTPSTNKLDSSTLNQLREQPLNNRLHGEQPDWSLVKQVMKALHFTNDASMSLSGMICVPLENLAEALGVENTGPVDCMVTEWTPWSECSHSCGNAAQKERTRQVKLPAQNGGQPCPVNLHEYTRCYQRPCPLDCRLSPWSEWSQCSSTCGNGEQTRWRHVEQRALSGGRRCAGTRIARRPCFTGIDCPSRRFVFG